MPEPKIVMNASAWYKLAANAYNHDISMKHDETGFLLDGIRVTIVPYFKEDHDYGDDPTGHPV